MPDRQREQPSFGANDRAVVEEACDGRRVERGRHHNDAKLRPSALKALQQRESEIAVEVAFVELVEHDGVDALEHWVSEKAAGENAFGDEAETCARADLFFEADLVADGFADVFAEFACDAARGHAGGDAARFQHDDFAADDAEERGWDAGRLSGAGWGFDDEAGRALQGCEDLRQNRVYRKCWLSSHCVDRNTGVGLRSTRFFIMEPCRNVNFKPKSISSCS